MMEPNDFSWVDPTTPIGELTVEQIFFVLKERCNSLVLITETSDENKSTYLSFYSVGETLRTVGMLRVGEKQLLDDKDDDED
jgi:hypothetical protein